AVEVNRTQRQFIAVEHERRRRPGAVGTDGKFGQYRGRGRVQRHVKFDGSDPPIGRAIVLEPDRPWFFSAHGAADLEGLRDNGKCKRAVGWNTSRNATPASVSCRGVTAAVRHGRSRVELWETDGAAYARGHPRRRAPH